jgi:hypothetical protein
MSNNEGVAADLPVPSRVATGCNGHAYRINRASTDILKSNEHEPAPNRCACWASYFSPRQVDLCRSLLTTHGSATTGGQSIGASARRMASES